jgi:fatty-acyl-CoA synthase
MAVVEPSGYLRIVDRKKDIIISGGENISSVEVEDVLYGHPDVRECAVVGRPDAKWGEVVHAAVSLKPGASASPAELLAWAAEHLAAFKAPRTIEIWDDLPKTGTGKVLKARLRSLLQGDAGRG